MSNLEDGGPAYPIVDHKGTDWVPRDKSVWDTEDGTPVVSPGMSLRDYFAGQVLPGLITDYCRDKGKVAEGLMSSDYRKECASKLLASAAYAMADAMLAARTAALAKAEAAQ